MNGKLCAPAILYVGFSLTQIIIDTFKGFYDVAFFKSIVMIVFTIVLNALCSQGLGIISLLRPSTQTITWFARLLVTALVVDTFKNPLQIQWHQKLLGHLQISLVNHSMTK